jgi:hypothetical protein
MRSFSNRMFCMSDDAGYRHSSSGNSSLGSAEFSLMASPCLGHGVLHGATPAAANLPGAHLSGDALNFSWTTSHATSPRPPSQNTTLMVSGAAIPSTGKGHSSKDMPRSRLSTPSAQLPLFGASPVPVAPASTFNTGAGYLGMIDTGLPCDITPLTSLSSPGGHSDDGSWKWDPSVNSLMNLASLSQCVLTTGSSSPTDLVVGGEVSATSDLSSVSSVLFANGGNSRRSSRSSSSSRGSRRVSSAVPTSGPGEGGAASASSRHSHTPCLTSKMSRPPDSSDRQIYLHSRSMEAADTPNAMSYDSPAAEVTASRNMTSVASNGIAHRRVKTEVHASPAEESIREMNPPMSQPRRMATRGTPKAEVSEAISATKPPSTRGASGARSHRVKEEGGNSRKRPYPHHSDQQSTTAAEDNIMRVAIGDAKRLRMLSPAVAVASPSMTREGSETSSASIVSEYTSAEEKEDEEQQPGASLDFVGETSSSLSYAEGFNGTKHGKEPTADKRRLPRRATASAAPPRRPPPRASRNGGNK